MANTNQSPSQTTTLNTTQNPNNSTTPNITQNPNNSTTPNKTQNPNNSTTPNTNKTTTPNATQNPNNSTTPNATQNPNNSTTPNTTQNLNNSTTPNTNKTTTPNTTQNPNNSTIQSSSQNTDSSTTRIPSTTVDPQVKASQGVPTNATQKDNKVDNCTESKDTTPECATNKMEMSTEAVTQPSRSLVNQTNSTNSQPTSMYTNVASESYSMPSNNPNSSAVSEKSNGNFSNPELLSHRSIVSSLSPPTPSTANLTSHTRAPTRETSTKPGENTITSNAGTSQSTPTNPKTLNPEKSNSKPSQGQMKCVNETDEYITSLFLNESFRCEDFAVGETGRRLANLVCGKLREKRFISYCEVVISPNSGNQKHLKITDVVVKVSKEEVTRIMENLKSALGKMNINTINASLDDSSAEAMKTKKMVALSVTGILLLLIFTFGIIYMSCQYKSKHRKAQPYLNEELQTIDNCCHDNPAFTESHAEMQEKKGKLKSGFMDITEGFGEDTDSWIAPLEKDEPEEDTHL